MHSCGQRACSANVFFRTKHTQICAHKFSLVESKGLTTKSLVFLKKDKKKGKKKGPTTLVVTLRRRFVVDDPSTTAHLESRGRFARTNPFPTRKSRGDGSNAFARVSSGAIGLRAILEGLCGVDDAFSRINPIVSKSGARLFAPNFWDDTNRRRRRNSTGRENNTARLVRPPPFHLQTSTTREGEPPDRVTAERERERKTSNRNTQ